MLITLILISYAFCKVNEELNLSPGEHTRKAIEIHTMKNKKESERKSSTSFGKRRAKLKSLKQSGVESKEIREGTTYESGVSLDDTTTIDIQEIPSPTTSPAVSSLPDGNYTFIAFDLETTGLGLYYFAQE